MSKAFKVNGLLFIVFSCQRMDSISSHVNQEQKWIKNDNTTKKMMLDN